MLSSAYSNTPLRRGPITTRPVQGRPIESGAGFSALSFDHKSFDGLMDPLVLVDHFTMSAPTFGPHPHAGLAAVSILFEDSAGCFHNRDSLGNDLDLGPGDLYWLRAGRGVVHDEKPRPGSRVHALQVFVNLRARSKRDAPAAMHVPAAEMPVLRGEGFRVRVMLGGSNGVEGANAPALPLTVLDAQLDPQGEFVHAMPADTDVWVLAVSGDAEVSITGPATQLRQGFAVAMRTASTAMPLTLRAQTGAHLAVLQGAPIRERFVQQGPFVMANTQDLRRGCGPRRRETRRPRLSARCADQHQLNLRQTHSPERKR